jgi:hypothetical protein
MDKTSKSYRAGRDAYNSGLLFSDEPSLLNFSVNIEEWKAVYIDALAEAVRALVKFHG